MSSIILLPPSEGKRIGGRALKRNALTLRNHPLHHQRHEMLVAVQNTVGKNLANDPQANQKLFGVKGEALERAVEATMQLDHAIVMSAFERYSGVLYDAIDVSTLNSELMGQAEESIFIFSGLFGLLRPQELIPDYRLKMSASLFDLGKVSTWWRPHISSMLAKYTTNANVWNLLPNEHDVAWDPTLYNYRPNTELRVKFVMKGPQGKWQVVNHWNKLLKGALVRYLLEHPNACVEDLVKWHHPEGYRLDLEFSPLSQGKVQEWQRELYFVKR